MYLYSPFPRICLASISEPKTDAPHLAHEYSRDPVPTNGSYINFPGADCGFDGVVSIIITVIINHHHHHRCPFPPFVIERPSTSSSVLTDEDRERILRWSSSSPSQPQTWTHKCLTSHKEPHFRIHRSVAIILSLLHRVGTDKRSCARNTELFIVR